MSAVTIGATALECTDGGEGEPILIGDESRAYAGSQRNSVRAQKRVFGFTTVPTAEATWDTLRAAVALRAQVTCTGAILSGDTLTASVKISAKAFPGLPGYFIITGTGEEV
jgi:hypothetical protein